MLHLEFSFLQHTTELNKHNTKKASYLAIIEEMVETDSNAIVGSKIKSRGNKKVNRAATTGKATTTPTDTTVLVISTGSTIVQEHPQPRQSPSSLQRSESDTPTLPTAYDDDDDTNPQQGAQQQQQQEQQQQQHLPVEQQQRHDQSTSQSPKRSSTTATHQPTTSATPSCTMTTTKIPPTIKDYRKIFVGGLPSDGKYINECMSKVIWGIPSHVAFYSGTNHFFFLRFISFFRLFRIQ
jgi:hypothetical protein